jgi:hypothetical protein
VLVPALMAHSSEFHKRGLQLLENFERLIPIQRRRTWRQQGDRPARVLDELGDGRVGHGRSNRRTGVRNKVAGANNTVVISFVWFVRRPKRSRSWRRSANVARAEERSGGCSYGAEGGVQSTQARPGAEYALLRDGVRAINLRDGHVSEDIDLTYEGPRFWDHLKTCPVPSIRTVTAGIAAFLDNLEDVVMNGAPEDTCEDTEREARRRENVDADRIRDAQYPGDLFR